MGWFDEWDETGEPIKRPIFVVRMLNRSKGKVRKIMRNLHFFFTKIRLSESRYTQLHQHANMWDMISKAIKCDVTNEYFDAKGNHDTTLCRFATSSSYTLEIDAGKIRDMFFKTDLPVKISIIDDNAQMNADLNEKKG